MTTRDKVWSAALLQLVKTGKFRVDQLPFNERKRHTVRRVLKEMEGYGWLSRRSKMDATWRMGPKAEMCLNVSQLRIEQSRK